MVPVAAKDQAGVAVPVGVEQADLQAVVVVDLVVVAAIVPNGLDAQTDRY